ncbi:MAG TPA: hypothetical protein GYA07_04090 [Verrucomicrobia bacterium]|nr:hypothetical protein [Verrucomicrobiota bacterium]HOB32367.1 hypothetical protein [Verrucomicrobiota bacterium]HOP96821.1 hypothetical protein [Verrucomicrobiota bacterium]
MGRSYLFECPKCFYRATVSGGEDRGRDVRVQTICCHDCRRLYDAVVSLRVASQSTGIGLGLNRQLMRPDDSSTQPPRLEAVLNRLPLPLSRHFRWAHYKPRCPVSASHKTEPWSNPGKCPVCGVLLDQSPLPFRRWE